LQVVPWISLQILSCCVDKTGDGDGKELIAKFSLPLWTESGVGQSGIGIFFDGENAGSCLNWSSLEDTVENCCCSNLFNSCKFFWISDCCAVVTDCQEWEGVLLSASIPIKIEEILILVSSFELPDIIYFCDSISFH
jgi:hypothetical protein